MGKPDMVTMSEQTVKRIDGVPQTLVIEEKAFVPDGIMEHQYIPLETVQIQQLSTGVMYSTDYWSVDRFWHVWLHPVTYEILTFKFLQGRPVSLDYSTYTQDKKIKVFIPRDKRVDGFSIVYKEHMDALKTMNSEERDVFMAGLGYDDAEGIHYAMLTR